MKENESYNENELRKLEEELRSYGVPYRSNEPDDRYWANFRVRLNERLDSVDAAKRRSVVMIISEWFSVSIIRSVAIGAVVVVVAVTATMMLRTSTTTIAPTEHSVAQVTTETQNQTPAALNPQEQTQTAPDANSDVTQHTEIAKQSEEKNSVTDNSVSKDLAAAGDDLSNYDTTLSPGKSDEPVDYSTLSEAELQSVLTDINSMSSN